MENKSGISLIALIITIVVIIILASIVITMSLGTPEQANYAKFLSDITSIEDTVRTNYIKLYGEKVLNGEDVEDQSVIKEFTKDNGNTKYIGDSIVLELDEEKLGINLPKYTNSKGENCIWYVSQDDNKVFLIPGFEYEEKIFISQDNEADVPIFEKVDETTEFTTDYGLIDIIWLSGGTNEVSDTANPPDLYEELGEANSLKPVTWSYYEDGVTIDSKIVHYIEDETPKSPYYNYSADKGNDGKEDNTTSMWANAKDKNGSYFVWIPRYAYRITYYSDESYTNITGYYDGYGMWSAQDNKKKYDLDEGIETVKYNGKKYIVHPAFVNDTNKTDSSGNKLEDYARGGWDTDLTGIWVAKYEMSKKDSQYLSVPNVKSVDKVILNTMFDASLAYDTDKESHMLKSSEWGAVAYLTHSQYGRNGHEIDINSNSSQRITGGGDIGKVVNQNETCEYNTILGAKASSTGNIYGIYDLSGGAWEHVAGYNKLGNPKRYSNGSKMLKKDSEGNYISTKYAATYSNSLSDNFSRPTSENLSLVYSVGKVGDATKEVRKSTINDSLGYCENWFSDFSAFSLYGAAFIGRGGSASEDDSTGIFYSDSTMGQSLSGVSFRISMAQ